MEIILYFSQKKSFKFNLETGIILTTSNYTINFIKVHLAGNINADTIRLHFQLNNRRLDTSVNVLRL